MSPTATPPPRHLLLLDCDISSLPHPQGRILRCPASSSSPLPPPTALLSSLPHLPDGITIDRSANHIYWTNMGPSLSTDSGSIERATLPYLTDRRVVIPSGTLGVFTPKQIVLAPRSRTLYWCDREGMKVMRCRLPPSDTDTTPEVEVVLSTGDASLASHRADPTRWCVGVAVDEARSLVYWTQKGPSKGRSGRILRARLDHPSPSATTETLFDGLPEPVDLELDEEGNWLYWTDRGDPPRGNSLNRAFVGEETGETKMTRTAADCEMLATRLHEAIGLAVDWAARTAYVTDLAGGVYAIDLYTREKRVLYPEVGDLTGLALV